MIEQDIVILRKDVRLRLINIVNFNLTLFLGSNYGYKRENKGK